MSFTVHGIDGVLLLLSCLLFLIAAVVAWFVARTLWAACIAAGLLLVALTGLVH